MCWTGLLWILHCRNKTVLKSPDWAAPPPKLKWLSAWLSCMPTPGAQPGEHRLPNRSWESNYPWSRREMVWTWSTVDNLGADKTTFPQQTRGGGSDFNFLTLGTNHWMTSLADYHASPTNQYQFNIGLSAVAWRSPMRLDENLPQQ